MIEWLLPALLGGIGVACVAGPLGAFLVWRRMAYFGDTLAHSALLGVAMGLAWEWSLNAAVLSVCLLLGVSLHLLQRQKDLSSDTLLGILSHSSLALGLLVLSLTRPPQMDLSAYLFGDILLLTYDDLLWIYLGGAAVLAVLVTFWNPLLAMTVNEAVAQVEGVPVARMRFLLTILLAVLVAMAMKITGLLLITALLIIPAASARHWARTPEQMVLIASLLGVSAVLVGVALSALVDLPVGPAIVLCSACLFFLSRLTQR